MAESWLYKLPTQSPKTHPGPVEFGDGTLKLMEIVDQDGVVFNRTLRAYSPQAWEWAERKPEGV